MSQLDLSLEAGLSSRHLSFIESGRALPSREMLLRLAQTLEVPLRERNTLLLAAGYAPAFRERPISHPDLDSAHKAVARVLEGHEPYPALAVDRGWNLVACNRMVGPLLAGAKEELLRPPINVLRLSLHPGGLAPRILNLPEWRDHLLHRLRQDAEHGADPGLVALLEELQSYPVPSRGRVEDSDVLVPLRLATEWGPMHFISTTTVFGTPTDVTLQELAIEAFFPADEPTRTLLESIRLPQA